MMKCKLLSMTVLILLEFMMLIPTVISQDDGLTAITFLTNHHRVFAEITPEDPNIQIYPYHNIPATIYFPPGEYTLRFMLAGYETQEMHLEVTNLDSRIWITLQPDPSWRNIYHNTIRFHYNVVRFKEKDHGFDALIDIASQDDIDAYLLDGIPIENSLVHYIYSHSSNLFQEIERYDIPILDADQAIDFELSDWATSEFAYYLVSPSGEYTIWPEPTFDISEDMSNLWLVNLNTNERYSIGMLLSNPGLPWNTEIFWAEDSTSVLVSDKAGEIPLWISITENDLQQTESISLLSIIQIEIPDALTASPITVSTNLERIMMFVTSVGPSWNLVVVDTIDMSAYKLPVSDKLYGAQWHNPDQLILLNADGLLQLDFPSFEIYQLLPPNKFILRTLNHVYFPPDVSYMIAHRPEYYGEALLIYDFEELPIITEHSK